MLVHIKRISGNDHRAFGIGIHRVADLDGNAAGADRQDGILVEHGCAHVGKLAQFAVADPFDLFGIVNDTRIGSHDTGDIGPVLIKACLHASGNDGAGHIRAASCECGDFAMRVSAIEAGNHRVGEVGEDLPCDFVCQMMGKNMILLEDDQILGIDKRPSQIRRENFRIEVFPSGRQPVGIKVMAEFAADLIKFFVKIKLNAESFDDFAEPLIDDHQGRFGIIIIEHLGIDPVQKIGDLDVPVKAFSRG